MKRPFLILAGLLMLLMAGCRGYFDRPEEVADYLAQLTEIIENIDKTPAID